MMKESCGRLLDLLTMLVQERMTAHEKKKNSRLLNYLNFWKKPFFSFFSVRSKPQSFCNWPAWCLAQYLFPSLVVETLCSRQVLAQSVQIQLIFYWFTNSIVLFVHRQAKYLSTKHFIPSAWLWCRGHVSQPHCTFNFEHDGCHMGAPFTKTEICTHDYHD